MQQGLAQVWDDHQDDYDWFLYMDDDNYLRTSVIQFYLSTLDPTEVIFVGTT